MIRTLTFIYDVDTDGDLNDSTAPLAGVQRGDFVRTVQLSRDATVHVQCARVDDDGLVTLTVQRGPNGFDREVMATLEV